MIGFCWIAAFSNTFKFKTTTTDREKNEYINAPKMK